ncbi:MAG: hypothetical protein JXK93_03625 [Sphaerochaetaceae bacterium]|nr:hypothetical protein [Sphaerochaetaceae bacterium]
MKQKRLTYSIITVLLVSLMLLSCNVAQETHGYGTLTVNFAPSGRIFERTIMPVGSAPLDIDHYTISGVGPEGQLLSSTNSTSDTITIDDLLVGNWTFEATAYNASDIPLANGRFDTYIYGSTNTITLSLDEVVGSGSMHVDFSWNTQQVTSDTDFVFTLTDQSGTPVTGITINTDILGGTSTVTKELDAGFYTFSAILTHSGVQIAGYTESIRIIDSTVSDADANLIIGKVIDNVGMTITDVTDGVIVGSIAASDPSPSQGDPVTLTFTASDTAGLSNTDLVYQWYADGSAISGATTHEYVVGSALSGSIRYDIIVGSAGNPIMGSASYTVSVSPNPSIAN